MDEWNQERRGGEHKNNVTNLQTKTKKPRADFASLVFRCKRPDAFKAIKIDERIKIKRLLTKFELFNVKFGYEIL